MYENKQAICNELVEVLRMTRCFSDLQRLDYHKENDRDEHVIAVFENYTKSINVSMDSGIAMIRDILNQID